MKRLFSKKTGFTLVEILIAFVIFAIMASMILAIMRLAIAARASNNTYAQELAYEKEVLVREDKETEYDATGTTGTFTLPFSGGGATETVTIDYEIKSAIKDAQFAEEGLNYFIPDIDKSDEGVDTPGSGIGSGTQASRYDTRITGSKGFEKIRLIKVEKYTGTKPTSGVRYVFQTSATADESILDSLSMPYAQYKLYFKDSTNTTTEDYVNPEDGKTYTRTKYTTPKILEVGYAKGTDSSNYEFFSTRNSDNPYLVTVLRNGGVQISYDYMGGGKQEFDGSLSVFYVDFDSDPGLTVSSFGSNVADVPGFSSKDYTVYVDDDGNSVPNIYGAYDYVDVEKS